MSQSSDITTTAAAAAAAAASATSTPPTDACVSGNSVARMPQKRWGRIYSLFANYKTGRVVLQEYTCNDETYTLVSEKPLENKQECLDCMKNLFDLDIAQDPKLSVIFAKFDDRLSDFLLFCIFLDQMIIKLATQDATIFPQAAIRMIHSNMTKHNIDLMNTMGSDDEKRVRPEHLILACQISRGTKAASLPGLKKKLLETNELVDKVEAKIQTCWPLIFGDKVRTLEDEMFFMQDYEKHKKLSADDSTLSTGATTTTSTSTTTPTIVTAEPQGDLRMQTQNLYELIKARELGVESVRDLLGQIGRVSVRVVYIKSHLLDQIQDASDLINMYKFYKKRITSPILAELAIPPRSIALLKNDDDLIETYKTLSWYQSLYASPLEYILPLVDQVRETHSK